MKEQASKILIIDDDEDFKKLLIMRLKSFLHNIHVTNFANLSSARQFLETQKELAFDLVILDEHLPDGRGIEILSEGWFEGLAVLSISSDTNPDIPGRSVEAGARYFLNKTQVKEALFRPLVRGIMDRNKLRRELEDAKLKSVVIDTVKTLVGTLRHEINNPLGAVLGAAYLMKTGDKVSKEQKQAAELVESSGQRIKHVLEKLCEAIELDSLKKADQKVFHIPGDEPWEKPE